MLEILHVLLHPIALFHADTIKGGLRPPTMRDKIKDADADALADADTLNGGLRPPAIQNKKSEHNGQYYVAEWVSLKTMHKRN